MNVSPINKLLESLREGKVDIVHFKECAGFMASCMVEVDNMLGSNTRARDISKYVRGTLDNMLTFLLKLELLSDESRLVNAVDSIQLLAERGRVMEFIERDEQDNENKKDLIDKLHAQLDKERHRVETLHKELRAEQGRI